MLCLIVATFLSAALLTLSKQAAFIAGHEVAADYSQKLGTLLVQLDIANEKNCTLWVFMLQAGMTTLAIPFSGQGYMYARRRKC